MIQFQKNKQVYIIIDLFLTIITRYDLSLYIYVAVKKLIFSYHEFSIFSKIKNSLENIQKIFLFMNLIYQMPQSDEGSGSTDSIRAMNHSTIRIHFLQTVNHVEKCQGILWSSAIRPIKVVKHR